MFTSGSVDHMENRHGVRERQGVGRQYFSFHRRLAPKPLTIDSRILGRGCANGTWFTCSVDVAVDVFGLYTLRHCFFGNVVLFGKLFCVATLFGGTDESFTTENGSM